ncbi:MAG: Holliday junction resolvase RuvX [Bacillota bacterium]
MKVLGLDLGSRSLGIAISDQSKMIARGLENYRFDDMDYDQAINRIKHHLKQEPTIEKIILGYPKNMNGTIGTQGKLSETFKSMLEEATDIPIILWDERLTSKMASSQMIFSKKNKKKRQKTLDQEAAVLILQSYLDQT